MKILELLEQRIEKVRKHLNKEKQIMDINKGKEKIVMEREVILVESDTSCYHNPFQATSDHNLFQATSDESSDHNPFQATFDESSDHNPFQVGFDDTLKSSFEDTCSSDSTWEQKKLPKRTVYKGKPGSSSRNAAIIKYKKPKSRSKHLVPTTPGTGSTCTTLLVQTKRPPPVANYVLGLAAVTTWQQIMNKEFKIRRSKEDVGGSSYVRRKGKKKIIQALRILVALILLGNKKTSKSKLGSRSTEAKKTFNDKQRTVYKGRPGSSSRNAAIIKYEKPKSRSKHLVPTTPGTGSTCTTLVVQTKRPPPVANYVLGLVAVTTWQQIMNKEFKIRRSKEDVGGSSYVRRKGKRNILNSWVSVPQKIQENSVSVTKMSVPVTAKEKINKKNDVKARSLLLMALPNEHQLTFSQYNDAKIMFAAIET
nr:hypothetical protein [Tanacetum cinerariifolium]